MFLTSSIVNYKSMKMKFFKQTQHSWKSS